MTRVPATVVLFLAVGSSYPGRVDQDGMNDEEVEIIRAFYGKKGVTVLDTRIEWIMKAVCEACSCPEGYTLHLLVPVADVPVMMELGFAAGQPG